MTSIKLTVALIFCALIVWLISNLPSEIALAIYNVLSYIFGVLGFLVLFSFILLLIYSHFKL